MPAKLLRFTKPPWEILGPFREPAADWTRSRFIVRAEEAPGGICAIIGGLGEEEEGNAYLIAAAPLMRQALKAWQMDMDRLGGASDATEGKMRAALALAETRL